MPCPVKICQKMRSKLGEENAGDPPFYLQFDHVPSDFAELRVVRDLRHHAGLRIKVYGKVGALFC